ncbi:MAG: hypothetical protein GY940_21510 [bacterium]|nr:hypothetical protein [bacterium]
MVERMEGELNGEWDRVYRGFVLDEIEAFAKTVRGLGKEYRLAFLSRWGEGLLEQAEGFDVDGMRLILASFPRLVGEIGQMVK